LVFLQDQSYAVVIKIKKKDWKYRRINPTHPDLIMQLPWLLFWQWKSWLSLYQSLVPERTAIPIHQWNYHSPERRLTSSRQLNSMSYTRLPNSTPHIAYYRVSVPRVDNAENGSCEGRTNGIHKYQGCSFAMMQASSRMPGYEQLHDCGTHQCCPRTRLLRREVH